MAKICFLVCVVVIVAMDVVAGILSIEAEAAQNKVKHKRPRLRSDQCKDANHDAFKLGLASVVLLALAHLTLSLFAGCMCVCSAEEFETSAANRQASFACLIFSWFTVAGGLPTLIIGTLANSTSRESCGILHLHLLSGGGILCFFHGICCIAYYISATACIGILQRMS